MSWIRINQDDERRLTPRERGFTFGEGDIIFVRVEHVDGTKSEHLVRYDLAPGGAFGFYDFEGDPPLRREHTITEWRYADTVEAEDFERRERAVERLRIARQESA